VNGSCWRSQAQINKKIMWHFTGKGDQGDSNLYDGRRISKGDLVFELIGTLDEANAYLGLAISFCKNPEEKAELRIIQDQLSKLMGFIAGVKIAELEEVSFLTGASDWLESKIKDYGNSINNPKAFLFAGETVVGASIDISRTVIRRAERCAVKYYKTGKDRGKEVLTFLNRLSSFLYILRLFIDRQ
jgi:cob(I)alamin adenosyltransferase